ncbi:MAG: TrkH family potassium uptake protein, partial [Clostridia bacterium]|nr:TrkH family potassium uptake protein [Clostridia bacterium]
ITVRDGGVMVVFAWILTCLVSSIPFLMLRDMNFTLSVFESVSGWTTTGLSVVNVELAPHIYLFWRSFMQLLGGAGIAVIVLASIIGPAGSGLYSAEGRSDLLLPNVTKSAKLMMSIYLGYVISGTILYIIAGMPVFDSINHAMAALSTGGFSTVTGSIGEYNSAAIEIVTIILMFAGTINFAAHYLLLKGRFRQFAKQGESRFMVFILSLAVPAVVFLSLNQIYSGFGEAFRKGFFNLVSALSTTGFSTVDYNTWPVFSIFILIMFMLIGGGTGSTAGGIKQYRIYIMVRSIIKHIRGFNMPARSIKELKVERPEGKVFLQEKEELRTGVFISIYMLLYFAGVMIFLLHGYSLTDSMFEFASSIGTVGLSIGITTADAPVMILWTEIIGMIMGRLEILVIFYAGARIIRDLKALLRKPIV